AAIAAARSNKYPAPLRTPGGSDPGRGEAGLASVFLLVEMSGKDRRIQDDTRRRHPRAASAEAAMPKTRIDPGSGTGAGWTLAVTSPLDVLSSWAATTVVPDPESAWVVTLFSALSRSSSLRAFSDP